MRILNSSKTTPSRMITIFILTLLSAGIITTAFSSELQTYLYQGTETAESIIISELETSSEITSTSPTVFEGSEISLPLSWAPVTQPTNATPSIERLREENEELRLRLSKFEALLGVSDPEIEQLRTQCHSITERFLRSLPREQRASVRAFLQSSTMKKIARLYRYRDIRILLGKRAELEQKLEVRR